MAAAAPRERGQPLGRTPPRSAEHQLQRRPRRQVNQSPTAAMNRSPTAAMNRSPTAATNRSPTAATNQSPTAATNRSPTAASGGGESAGSCELTAERTPSCRRGGGGGAAVVVQTANPVGGHRGPRPAAVHSPGQRRGGGGAGQAPCLSLAFPLRSSLKQCLSLRYCSRSGTVPSARVSTAFSPD